MTPQASNSSTQAPEPETPRGLKGSGLKYTEADGVPSWAVGKTADEILRMTNDLYGALQRNETPSPTPSPAPTPQPNVTSNGIPEVDPNLIYSDPAAYHRQMEARMNAIVDSKIGQASSSVVTPIASLARAEAKRNAKYKAAWTKWEPEIDLIMQRVPESQRGRVDLWNEAARMVQGEHADEIAETRAREIIAASGDAGMLSTQGSPNAPRGTSSLTPIAKLYADDHPAVKGYKSDGIPAAKVIERARAQGIAEDAYAKILIERHERSRKPQPIA